MMWSLNIYQSLNDLLLNHEEITNKIDSLHTQAMPNQKYPYIIFDIQQCISDCPIYPTQIIGKFSLNIYSQYNGLKEILELQQTCDDVLLNNAFKLKAPVSEIYDSGLGAIKPGDIKLKQEIQNLTRKLERYYEFFIILKR